MLERLGNGSATITELAEPFGISLTGMKKHVRVLEEAGLVTTEKVGPGAACSLGPRRLDDVQAWIETYRRMLDERLDRFGELLERTKGDAAMTADRSSPEPPPSRRRPSARSASSALFDAPRDRVFARLHRPRADPRVVGPARHDHHRRRDGRRGPGGDWRFVAATPTAARPRFRGTYREVTPPERIVQTFEWEGMPGHVSVETAVFEDLGDRTRSSTTSIFHTTEERDGMLGSGMEGGMNETYQRLDELLERLGA